MKNLLEENREEFIMDKQARMKKLVEVLNQASKAYYQEDRELFSNKEYDELYDELQALEAETGIVIARVLHKMSVMKYSVSWKKRHTKARCSLLIRQRVQKH